jgi:Tfp pilus tip-associated adhesin PilY1
VYTAKKNADGSWSKMNFDTGNLANLCGPLNITPTVCDDGDERDVIERVRGQYWNSTTAQWFELSNKLGAIMHSAPAIIGGEQRTGGSRTEIAYVGSLDGMLHAIETDTGSEKWAYIPNNLLEKLQNDRSNPNATGDFAAVDASPAAKDVYYDHDNDGYKEWRTVVVSAEGQGGNAIFALDVTDPDAWSVLWEATDTQAPAGGMGHAYRVAIDKVRWPITEMGDANDNGIADEILGYEMKWVVFVSTGYADIATNHGGIHVFAFDLKTGGKLWAFSAEYADSVNDIPGAVTVFDADEDSFADYVYVGDMNGRLWELDAIDGTNPNGQESGEEIPLFNAGVGNPISVSPAIYKSNDHTIVVFGTGGANWASDAQSYAIYAVDATDKKSVPTYASGAGTLLWQNDLGVGEKVWSTPTIAYGYIFATTAYGSMEGSDPRMDLAAEGEDSGNFYKLKLSDGDMVWSLTHVGKVRGSIYVDRQHAYMTTIDGQIIQIGGEDFSAGSSSNVSMFRRIKRLSSLGW